MKKRRGNHWSVAVVCLGFYLFSFGGVDEASAVFTFLEGKFSVTGFVRNDSAVRLDDGSGTQERLDAGDLTLCRNTFQLEVEWKPLDWFTLFVMPRLVYDAAMDLNRKYERDIFSKERHDFKTEDDIREVYADIVWGNTRIRTGKQQIMWGESDLFRMADVINPLDVSWDYVLYSSVSSFEDIRIPLWAVDFFWSQPTGHQWAVEFVWLPGFIEDGFEPVKVAPENANWNIPGQPQFFIDSIRDSEPEDGWENSEFGLRLKAVFRGWDLALFYFYTRMDHPTPKEDIFQRLVKNATTNPFYGVGPVPGLPIYFWRGEYFSFPFVNKLGATFNKYEDYTKTIWRGECVYIFNEPMPDGSIVNQTFTNSKIYEKDTFQYMLGFDRPTMIRFLNPNRSFLISMQFFQRYIINDDSNVFDASPGGLGSDSYQTLITLLMNTGYRWDTINPQLLTAYNLSGEGYINPQCEFWFGDHWRLGVGVNWLFSHNNKEPYFGIFRHNDQAYTWLKYQF
jgi:hypothetical protein